MKHLIDAVRQSCRDESWFGALALALALPDICASLEHGRTSRTRYAEWWVQYAEPHYTISNPTLVLLNGPDAYALRCSYLHMGSDDTTTQPVHDVVNSFVFVEPPGRGNHVHLNRIDKALQLQVDIFCEDICRGAELWLTVARAMGDVGVVDRIDRMIDIGPARVA